VARFLVTITMNLASIERGNGLESINSRVSFGRCKYQETLVSIYQDKMHFSAVCPDDVVDRLLPCLDVLPCAACSNIYGL